MQVGSTPLHPSRLQVLVESPVSTLPGKQLYVAWELREVPAESVSVPLVGGSKLGQKYSVYAVCMYVCVLYIED